MHTDTQPFEIMSLFSDDGERKYLNTKERKRFYKSRKVIKDISERSFVELLFWTGCRISEALQLNIMRVNVEDCFVVFKTLKQHGKREGKRFRIVHLPRKFMRKLNRIHAVLEMQLDEHANKFRNLWSFGRQKGWKLVKAVMDKAKIFGVRATPKGLRHTYGVNAIYRGAPLLSLQIWMGHQSLKTTSIYLKVIGMEDRAYAKRTWKV